jgi:hypothetical protein
VYVTVVAESTTTPRPLLSACTMRPLGSAMHDKTSVIQGKPPIEPTSPDVGDYWRRRASKAMREIDNARLGLHSVFGIIRLRYLHICTALLRHLETCSMTALGLMCYLVRFKIHPGLRYCDGCSAVINNAQSVSTS